MSAMPADRGDGDLWPFSLRVYAAPGVADACLAAQDSHGADVNLILWAAWLGARGHRLTPAELAAAEATSRPWREEIVRPLRALRRRLKQGPAPAPDAGSESVRAKIKAAELEAERWQQLLLTGLLPHSRGDHSPQAALSANLALLLPPEIAATVTEPLHAAIRNNG